MIATHSPKICAALAISLTVSGVLFAFLLLFHFS